jgi:hypothetical protein
MTVESGARPSKTLSGDLHSRPLAVLLAGACERGTSGTFTFRHGARRDTLTLRAGKIAGVRTHEPISYLGGVLHDLGAIDVPTLDATLHDVAKLQRLHGEVLIERGAVTREQLDQGLAEQTFRQVSHLFSLPEEATWAFRDDVDELSGARDEDRPAVDTWVAIWRGLRDRPVADHVHRTLAKIDGGIHLRDLSAIARFGLAREEHQLCVLLATRPTTLENLIAASALSAERTTLLVYLLALARCVVRVETPPVGPVDLGVEGVRERARRIDAEEPHTTLGVRAGASTEATRAAYFRLARLWHPDKLPPELAEVRGECEHVFARLGAAHRSLSPALSAPPASMHPGSVGPGSLFPRSMRPGATGPASVHPGGPRPGSIAPRGDGALAGRPTMWDVDTALARGDLKVAETHARVLVNGGAEGPTARAVLVWCGIGAGTLTDPEGLELAHAMLDRLLTGDPECTRALFYRGQIAKRLGRGDAAARDFRKVVRLDPTNLDAQREVRLHPVRRPSSEVSEEKPKVEPSGLSDRPAGPRPAEPQRVEPRSAEPRSPEPQRVGPPPAEPRSPEPQRVEPPPAEPRPADADATRTRVTYAQPVDASGGSGLRRLLDRIAGKK